MTTVNVLHLSDLHMREADLKDIDIVVSALLRDLALWMHGATTRPDVVCFTGDLAFSAKPEEYELAQQYFLDPLLQHWSCRGIACSWYQAITMWTARAFEMWSN
jgi:3',5'-cyclic AMP phosphodiesterase CpdA